jgi:hypothetical protein
MMLPGFVHRLDGKRAVSGTFAFDDKTRPTR